MSLNLSDETLLKVCTTIIYGGPVEPMVETFHFDDIYQNILRSLSDKEIFIYHKTAGVASLF